MRFWENLEKSEGCDTAAVWQCGFEKTWKSLRAVTLRQCGNVVLNKSWKILRAVTLRQCGNAVLNKNPQDSLNTLFTSKC